VKMEHYEKVLKLLDRWASETRAVSSAANSLDDKLHYHKFLQELETVRRSLRLHYHDAEDVSQHTFRWKSEHVLKAEKQTEATT